MSRPTYRNVSPSLSLVAVQKRETRCQVCQQPALLRLKWRNEWAGDPLCRECAIQAFYVEAEYAPAFERQNAVQHIHWLADQVQQQHEDAVPLAV